MRVDQTSIRRFVSKAVISQEELLAIGIKAVLAEMEVPEEDVFDSRASISCRDTPAGVVYEMVVEIQSTFEKRRRT